MSHVYSMYSGVPSELMSPNIFRTKPVEPLATVVGTIPLENPPAALIGSLAACAFAKVAVMVLFAVSIAVRGTVS